MLVDPLRHVQLTPQLPSVGQPELFLAPYGPDGEAPSDGRPDDLRTSAGERP